MLYAIVALLVVIADQAVKYWVAADAVINTVGIRKLIPGVISLVNVHNDGAAFSFLSGGGARIGFILVCGVFTVFVIIALATNMISGKVGRWSAVMVAAGGIGNCLDRILYGYVQDMFMLEFVNFAVFNVADIFITVFCIVFILYVIFGMREDDEEDDEEEEEEVVEEKPRKLRGKARRAAEEEEDEEPAPRQRKSRAAVEDEEPRKRARKAEPVEEEAPRKARRAKVEPEEEPARPAANSRKARQAKYEDEYAQYKAQKAQRQRAEPEVQAPVRRSATASNDPFAEWDNANARAQKAQRQEAQSYQPAAPARPARTEAPAPKKAAPVEDTDDFDLDSILNEFKF